MLTRRSRQLFYEGGVENAHEAGERDQPAPLGKAWLAPRRRRLPVWSAITRRAMPARAARSRPPRSARLLITRTYFRRIFGIRAASISACKFDPPARDQDADPQPLHAKPPRRLRLADAAVVSSACRWRPSPKLRYGRMFSAVGEREDTGSGAVCNDLAAESYRRLPAAGKAQVWRGYPAAAGGFGIPARAAEDDAFSATVKLDASADSAAKAREAARLDGQRRALAEIAGRLAGPGGAATIAEARRQRDHQPRRQFRGRQRADVAGALHGRLHFPLPPGRDPPRPCPLPETSVTPRPRGAPPPASRRRESLRQTAHWLVAGPTRPADAACCGKTPTRGAPLGRSVPRRAPLLTDARQFARISSRRRRQGARRQRRRPRNDRQAERRRRGDCHGRRGARRQGGERARHHGQALPRRSAGGQPFPGACSQSRRKAGRFLSARRQRGRRQHRDRLEEGTARQDRPAGNYDRLDRDIQSRRLAPVARAVLPAWARYARSS